MKLLALTTLFTMMTVVMTASSVTPLSNRLAAKKIKVNTIGCKCIMSKPSAQNTDSTLCMCFNRKDGTLNDTTVCRAYTDGVFSFCSDVTDGTELWQECVEHYCPCNGDIVEPPRNKIYF
ncbi:uncharacterized protein EV154DRAFT_582938 [Mucor mucedo]|uniref:Uncharacterized protein n=1 Tax=Mucor saturninus TaxID=64648 RepID=A0A8H7RBV4_9FUNG|nr:uncharacterized protein EV154DRAFT_582938 [Mucor mucedo]KAG2208316.1 hypothetical protein INT47_006172 [Mucor saturninus]KAI7893550.1 hypothetical protein EV154DRAFT_582938 [Mucor mucedo]